MSISVQSNPFVPPLPAYAQQDTNPARQETASKIADILRADILLSSQNGCRINDTMNGSLRIAVGEAIALAQSRPSGSSRHNKREQYEWSTTVEVISPTTEGHQEAETFIISTYDNHSEIRVYYGKNKDDFYKIDPGKTTLEALKELYQPRQPPSTVRQGDFSIIDNRNPILQSQDTSNTISVSGRQLFEHFRDVLNRKVADPDLDQALTKAFFGPFKEVATAGSTQNNVVEVAYRGHHFKISSGHSDSEAYLTISENGPSLTIECSMPFSELQQRYTSRPVVLLLDEDPKSLRTVRNVLLLHNQPAPLCLHADNVKVGDDKLKGRFYPLTRLCLRNCTSRTPLIIIATKTNCLSSLGPLGRPQTITDQSPEQLVGYLLRYGINALGQIDVKVDYVGLGGGTNPSFIAEMSRHMLSKNIAHQSIQGPDGPLCPPPLSRMQTMNRWMQQAAMWTQANLQYTGMISIGVGALAAWQIVSISESLANQFSPAHPPYEIAGYYGPLTREQHWEQFVSRQCIATGIQILGATPLLLTHYYLFFGGKSTPTSEIKVVCPPSDHAHT